MKKLFTFFAILASLATFAQAPEGFNYQATVRNSSGNLIINKNVDFTFKIIKDSPTGSTVYSEARTVMTDDLGAVNLVVGQGTPTTGTFSSINWGNGNYYLGIELNTGSGNVAMGTTQLLSVPYALYAKTAGSTQNMGRVTITITGNKTNAEAAKQLADEFGPLTENIVIFNTTGLTALDFSSLTKAQNVTIINNADLAVVKLNGVQYINQLTIKNDPKLTEFHATSLKDLFSDLFLQYDLSAFTTLNLPALTSGNMTVEGLPLSSLNIQQLTTGNLKFSSTALTSLNLPKLASGNVEVINTSLTSLNLSLLASGNVTLGNSSLTSLNLPLLASGNVHISTSPSLTSLNLPLFASGNVEVYMSPLTSLNLPLLTSGGLNIRNTSLTSLSLPLFTTSIDYGGGNFDISNNASLTSISIPVFTTIGTDFRVSGNSLPSSEINKLLAHLDTKATFTGYSNAIYLHQTPSAPPTGQGLVNKQSLINKGMQVMTD